MELETVMKGAETVMEFKIVKKQTKCNEVS